MKSIEEILNILSEDRQLVLIMKANIGYSAVLIKREEYFSFLLKPHYNGKTVGEAVNNLYEEKKI